MTTRPPLIPVEQVDCPVCFGVGEDQWRGDCIYCGATGRISAEAGSIINCDKFRDGVSNPATRLLLARAALTALEPHLEASRLQARREALEEAAKVADGVWDEAALHIENVASGRLTWRRQAEIADRIRIAIRARGDKPEVGL